MSSTYTATDAVAYERLMGRWSPRSPGAHRLCRARRRAGRSRSRLRHRRLLALMLARRAAPRRIGIDIAPPYIDYAASRSRDPRLDFRTGDASLALADSTSTAASRCSRSISWRRRRVRGGAPPRDAAGRRVAAAVWDFSGGLVYQRIFWDTAAALDPEAARARARQLSSPLTREGELAAAFAAAGCREWRRRRSPSARPFRILPITGSRSVRRRGRSAIA